MNKTIDVREEDVAVWDRAKEIADDNLSPLIIEGLKRFVVEKEGEPNGFERIEVHYSDSENYDIPRAKAFYGRWIFPPTEPLETLNGRTVSHHAVAVTAKGSAVVYHWDSDEVSDRFCETFHVFSSLDDAVLSEPARYAARKAIEKNGVPVQELDI